MKPLQVLLTGATGFVGSALLNRFVADGAEVTALVRSKSVVFPFIVKHVIGDLSRLDIEVPGQTRNNTSIILSEIDVQIGIKRLKRLS